MDSLRQESLEACCKMAYDEMLAGKLQPAREDLVRHEESILALIEMIRAIWIDEFGGNPMEFPWNRGHVLMTYIRYRKLTGKGNEATPSLHPLFKAEKGYVYFIQDERGRIKIGWSRKHPDEQRKKGLQTGNADVLTVMGWMQGTETLEKTLHYRFAQLRIRSGGEWFIPHEDLLNFIKENSQCL